MLIGITARDGVWVRWCVGEVGGGGDGGGLVVLLLLDLKTARDCGDFLQKHGSVRDDQILSLTPSNGWTYRTDINE